MGSYRLETKWHETCFVIISIVASKKRFRGMLTKPGNMYLEETRSKEERTFIYICHFDMM
jgi:hypothetical protein